MFNIFTEKKFTENIVLNQNEETIIRFDDDVNFSQNYLLEIVGEVGFDYIQRFEGLLPRYYRKIDDSLSLIDGEYVLNFNKRNEVKERVLYTMLRPDVSVGQKVSLSLKAKVQGCNSNFTVSAEVYYGKAKSRYYYQTPDEIYFEKLENSDDFKTYGFSFDIKNNVDFIMIKIDGTDFTGEAQLFAPVVTCGLDENICNPFVYEPDNTKEYKWIGEGFSLKERPHFEIYLNKTCIFNDIIVDRLQRFAGFQVKAPQNLLLPSGNEVTIKYSSDNVKPYVIQGVRILTAPSEFDMIAVKQTAFIDKNFAVLLSCKKPPVVEESEFYDYIGYQQLNENYALLYLKAKKVGQDITISAISDGVKKNINLGYILSKKQDDVITGSGDYIYVGQDIEEFVQFLTWYLNSNIGDLLTFRCVYHWGGADQVNEEFWKFAVKALSGLNIYYSLMYDGRELNGLNASPDESIVNSEYFLGTQTHERDGAYIYWDQYLSSEDELYYHLLSRKMKYNGIYGKCSPVYTANGEAKLYFDNGYANNPKDAYEYFKRNIELTHADGATRHTGVTTLFRTFYEAGYDWVGYESMYGPHELMLGAIRGTANAYNKKSFGTHLALQWSSIPTNDYRHFLRYRLSLFLSYMHGVTEINTEEGLWRIENPYVDFDHNSFACLGHSKEQACFNRFIQTHVRRGKLKPKIAMLIGKYDGMEGFSSPCVFGQTAMPYGSPEKSWEALKVFYPDADINAIYYYISDKDADEIPQKDKELMEVRKGLYRDVIKYKQVGFYSNTPYGVIDIIPVESDKLSDYEFLFFTGWNTADNEQLKNLYKFVKNGGTLMLSKPHLSTSYDRNAVLAGNYDIYGNVWVEKLLKFVDSGRVVFFDEDKYPGEYLEKYCAKLSIYAKKYANKYIKNTKYLSYTEYFDDKTSYVYLLNINWWNDEPAEFTLSIAKNEHKVYLNDNYPVVLVIYGDLAVYSTNLNIEVSAINDNKITLSGFGDTEIIVFDKDGKRSISVKVEDKKVIEI